MTESQTTTGPTRAEIMARVGKNGKGATRRLLASWGVPWPPPKGWRKDLLFKADQAAGFPLTVTSHCQLVKTKTETWEITTISCKTIDGTFVAKAEGRDSEGNKVGEVVAESKSLTRVVEMLAPAKPINI